MDELDQIPTLSVFDAIRYQHQFLPMTCAGYQYLPIVYCPQAASAHKPLKAGTILGTRKAASGTSVTVFRQCSIKGF